MRAPGADIHVEVRGRTPQAVFVHGFGGDLSAWDEVWRALGEDFPAMRYDLRGFGRSRARGDEPFDYADDMLRVLDDVGIARADVIGVSMGGRIALNFALDHPERVRNLVLISPGLTAWEWSEDWRARWAAITARARAGALDEAKRLWWEHPLFDSTRASPAAPALWRSIERFSGAQWIADHERAKPPDVERLHMLKPRTLLLSGDQDYPDFRLIADLIAGGAPDVARIDHAGCGHLLNLEAPEACAREILEFLGGPPV